MCCRCTKQRAREAPLAGTFMAPSLRPARARAGSCARTAQHMCAKCDSAASRAGPSVAGLAAARAAPRRKAGASAPSSDPQHGGARGAGWNRATSGLGRASPRCWRRACAGPTRLLRVWCAGCTGAWRPAGLRQCGRRRGTTTRSEADRRPRGASCRRYARVAALRSQCQLRGPTRGERCGSAAIPAIEPRDSPLSSSGACAARVRTAATAQAGGRDARAALSVSARAICCVGSAKPCPALPPCSFAALQPRSRAVRTAERRDALIVASRPSQPYRRGACGRGLGAVRAGR